MKCKECEDLRAQMRIMLEMVERIQIASIQVLKTSLTEFLNDSERKDAVADKRAEIFLRYQQECGE